MNAPPEGFRYRVLVVDDDEAVLRAHGRLVSALGYHVETAANGERAWELMPRGFDLLMIDGDMPDVDGFELAARVRSTPRLAHLPIIMVSGLTAPDDRRRALEVGVNDFINKPVNPDELALRAHWLIELKVAHDRLIAHSLQLEQALTLRTEALKDAFTETSQAHRSTLAAHLDTIHRLTIAAEYRDYETAGHIERIGLFAELLAQALGLSELESRTIGQAAPMHDVGKLGVPDAILLKPAALSPDEWEVMRRHTTVGARILTGSASPIIQMGERIALTHHEWWDGSGYPNGLREEAIPFEGRVCAVVDVFDALTMDRPYRTAIPEDEVMRMMREQSGQHFDPVVFEAFLDVRPQLTDARARATLH
jgi:putative two-component system response regulator